MSKGYLIAHLKEHDKESMEKFSEFDFYNYNLAEGCRIGYSSGSDKKFKKN